MQIELTTGDSIVGAALATGHLILTKQSGSTVDVGQVVGAAGAVGAVGATGATGATGPVGPANTLTIGTITTGATGTATITGTAPNQVLNLVLPLGAQGPTGPTGTAGPAGPAGPSSGLTVGTVTTGASGSSASASITGTAPNQILNLVVPAGVPGPTGATGPTPSPLVAINAVTATTYTFTPADANAVVVEGQSNSAQTFTVPNSAGVTFAVGSLIEVAQIGVGQITIAAASGVTLQNPSSLTTRAQFSTIGLRYRGSNIWLVSGDLT